MLRCCCDGRGCCFVDVIGCVAVGVICVFVVVVFVAVHVVVFVFVVFASSRCGCGGCRLRLRVFYHRCKVTPLLFFVFSVSSLSSSVSLLMSLS